MFPPWKIEAPIISPGPCISNSHRVTFVGRRKKRTLEMTYAYYVCATVIDDETATLQHTHTGFFYFFLFLWPVYEGAHMVPLASDQAQKILMCIRRLVFSSLGLCVCVCVYIFSCLPIIFFLSDALPRPTDVLLLPSIASEYEIRQQQQHTKRNREGVGLTPTTCL